MTREKHTRNHQENEIRLTRRGHVVAGLAAAGIAAVGVGYVASGIGHEMQGQQTVRIAPGDTMTDIVVDNVDGGAAEVKSVINYVVDTNPEVFQDGTASLGSEDLGQEIAVPEAVVEK